MANKPTSQFTAIATLDSADRIVAYEASESELRTVTGAAVLTWLGASLDMSTIASGGALPVARGGTGITSLGTGIATFLGTPSSANLLAAITDETGTGALVFATSPTLVTPTLGVASATSLACPTFTSSAAMGFTPAAGSGVNFNLSGDGDFIINTNQLFVDVSTGECLLGATSVPVGEYHKLTVVTASSTASVVRGINVESHNAGTGASTGAQIASYATGTNQDHMNVIQSWGYTNISGTMSSMAGLYIARTHTAGTITNWKGVEYAASSSGATNNYFLYSEIDHSSYLKGRLALAASVVTDAEILHKLFIYHPLTIGAFGIELAQAGIYGSDAAEVNKGGALVLGGRTGLASDVYGNAILFGGRESISTYAGYFAVYTVSGGAGGETNSANYERIRVTSTGNVGVGTPSPNANALLDLTSTTKAFMPPRMTTTQRDAIASPTEGMYVHNTTTKVLNFYNGTSWGAV